MRPIAIGLCLAFALGCGDDEEETTGQGGGGGAPTSECAVSERRAESGECCPPGTTPTPTECVPAGIPPESCGQGFVAQADWCEPTLPRAPCSDGTMALPGETRCRPLVECGQSPWGDIAVGNDTEYVDQTFAGTSDGSATAPWTTIQAGIDAATPGAVVAIAAGSYAEDLTIDKAVSVFGRCPQMVEIVGQSAIAAIDITSPASTGAGVGRLAVRGPNNGFLVRGGSDIEIDRVWIHDTGGRGLSFEHAGSGTSATLSASLLERASDPGVIALGATLAVRDTVIRDGVPSQLEGRAIGLVAARFQAIRARLSLEHSVISRAKRAGVLVQASDATVFDSVVRDIDPDTAMLFGHGIEIHGDPSTLEASVVEVRSSVIEGAHNMAVLINGAEVTFDGTLVRDILPEPGTGKAGEGIIVQAAATGLRGHTSIVRSVVERTHATGVFVIGADVTLEGSIVRDVQPGIAGGQSGLGIGLGAQNHPNLPERANVVVKNSRLDRNVGQSLRSQGSDISIEGLAIADTLPKVPEQTAGHGLVVVPGATGQPSTAVVTASLVERCHETGIGVSDATAHIENVLVRDMLPRESDKIRGYGIDVQRVNGTASGTLRDVVIENVVGVGLMARDAPLDAERVRIIGVAAQPDGLYGDGMCVALGSGIVRDSYIEGAARVGFASFGGQVTLMSTRLECNLIQLSGQAYMNLDYAFVDGGENRCGCAEATEQCKLVVTEIEPPPAIEP
jgi:hypothetical protein